MGILNKLKKFNIFSTRIFLGLIFGLISILIFYVLSRELALNHLKYFDSSVTTIIRWKMNNNLTLAATIITGMGTPAVFIIAALAVMAYLYFGKKHIWDTVQVPAVLLGSWLLNEGLKLIFNRQRPDIPHLVLATGLSFPSGHSMVSISFYGLLIYLIWVNTSNKVLQIISTLLLSALILFIGMSRVYLGVHYPSDVIAGFSAGLFWLLFSSFAFKAIRYYKSDKKIEDNSSEV